MPAMPRAPCSSIFTPARGTRNFSICFAFRSSMMPAVRSSSEVYGEVSAAPGLDGIPLAGIAGDQQAALFGQTMHPSRPDEEHLRHRMLHAAEHRPPRRAVVESAGHNGRLENWRRHRIRARRQRLCRRRRGAVAARWPGPDSQIRRRGSAGQAPCPTTAEFILSPRSLDWVRRTGIPTRAVPSSA